MIVSSSREDGLPVVVRVSQIRCIGFFYSTAPFSFQNGGVREVVYGFLFISKRLFINWNCDHKQMDLFTLWISKHHNDLYSLYLYDNRSFGMSTGAYLSQEETPGD